MLLPWYDEDENAYGYADEAGHLLIPVRYQEAGTFRDGLAEVSGPDGSGIVADDGHEVLPPLHWNAFTSGGWIHVFERGGAQALFDRDGRCVLRPAGASYLYYPEEGRVRIKRNERWGALDLEGRERIPAVHRSLGPGWRGRFPYYAEGGWGWLDREGRVLVPAQYTAVGPWDDQCWWGRHSGGRFEVFGEDNGRLSPFDITELNARSGPSGLVRSERGLHFFGPGFTPLLDLPPQYNRAWDFRCGRALAERAGRYGFIDENGTEVIEARYTAAGSFAEGLAPVQRDGRWGFIDAAGNEVIAAGFAAAGAFSGGLAPVKAAAGWGYIDSSGTEGIPCRFRSAGVFFNGLAPVSDGFHDWKIDRRGVRRTRPEENWE